jgi:hypothetical protein
MMDDLSGVEAVIFLRHAHERLQTVRAVLIKSRVWGVSRIDWYNRRMLLSPSWRSAKRKNSEPWDGGIKLLWNVGRYLPIGTVSYSIRYAALMHTWSPEQSWLIKIKLSYNSNHFVVFFYCNISDKYHVLHQWLNSANNLEFRGDFKNVVCSLIVKCRKFYDYFM